MKKILSSVFIILLLVVAYFIIFQGLSIGSIKILSVGQIIDSNEELTNRIAETNSLLKKDYASKKENLSSEVSQLLRKKEEYFNLAKISTEGELSKANTQETYRIEYLWTRVGRHATNKGVNIKMDVLAANAGDNDIKTLSFSVEGQYVGIIEFIYALEDDSELGFKIENFKMVPNDTNSTLVGTFNVNNVRIKTENTTATIGTTTTNNQNNNSQAKSTTTENVDNQNTDNQNTNAVNNQNNNQTTNNVSE